MKKIITLKNGYPISVAVGFAVGFIAALITQVPIPGYAKPAFVGGLLYFVSARLFTYLQIWLRKYVGWNVGKQELCYLFTAIFSVALFLFVL